MSPQTRLEKTSLCRGKYVQWCHAYKCWNSNTSPPPDSSWTTCLTLVNKMTSSGKWLLIECHSESFRLVFIRLVEMNLRRECFLVNLCILFFENSSRSCVSSEMLQCVHEAETFCRDVTVQTGALTHPSYSNYTVNLIGAVIKVIFSLRVLISQPDSQNVIYY